MRNGPIPAFPHSSDLEQYTVHRITIRSDGKDSISVSGKQVSPFGYTHTIKIFRITMHPPGRCLCVFHSKWIRTGAKMDFFAKSHPRGDRHTVYAQNRTRGATAIQFMRRIAPPGRPPHSSCAESHPRGDRHTVYAQNENARGPAPGVTVSI